MDNSDQPNSILHVNQLQMYPIPTGDGSAGSGPPPFPLLSGEGILYSGNSVYGALVLTNYRLFIQHCDVQQHHVPLGVIELVEHRDLFYLHICCKDARTYRLTFDTNETTLDWCCKLMKASAGPSQIEELFAFYYLVWSKQDRPQQTTDKLELQRKLIYDERTFKREVERLKFDLHGTWRISSINDNYKLCNSYPRHLLVPAYVTDDDLEIVAKFRSSRRIPTVVWRHVGNGAVIARCSQPEVGWLGWRSTEDEELLKAISESCTQDRGPHTLYSHSPSSINSSTEETTHIKADIENVEKKKVLIMDARSYTTAVANRARGGGCECPEYYPRCEIQFMNLANIHSIRKSFHALRQLCASSADQLNWFALLDGTRWLQHMSGLMRSAVTLVTAIERDARPVLVHCSDGWDRTPQIVALAELLLDPFYRTIEGFRILIEREWLAFGHKFADRCGHATGSEDINERCPVFLQWLDCVHQLLRQFPCAFEFSHTFLVKLAQHTYSNLFGTFLCNTEQERERVYETTFSVWLFLKADNFKNHLYSTPINSISLVLWPQYNVRELELWSEVYLGSMETLLAGSNTSETAANCHSPPESLSQHMTKTRSYGDLPHASEIMNGGHVRRCSDPNIAVDTIKMAGLKIVPPDDPSSPAPPPLKDGGTGGIVMNGRSETPTHTNFLCDKNDCSNDCLYKNLEQDDIEQEVMKNGNGFSDEDGVDAPGTLVIKKTETCDCERRVRDCCAHCGVDLDTRLDNGKYEGNKNFHVVSASDGLNSSTSATATTTDNNIAVVPTTFVSECESACNDDPSRRDSASDAITGNGDLLYSVYLDKSQIIVKGDINHNGHLKPDDPDSDTECTDHSDSKSENITVLCDTNLKKLVVNSVETSTETLVSENVCSSSSKEYNDFEKLSSGEVYALNGNGEAGRNSYQTQKSTQNKQSQQQSGNISEKTSRYSTPPLYSRTPSTSGWDGTFTHCNSGPPKYQFNTTLDGDGLIPLKSDVQERLWQIIDENKRKVDALERELHTYRKALIRQVCHKCNHNEGEKNDETSSVVDSVCSAGEGQASAVESLRSDMSWEAVEDGPSMPEGTTLWVPDHAVNKCTGCGIIFWLGKRKHHCRNCGRIFCADCSEYSTPLPAEQLFDPVRVCTSCYSKLQRRECRELPEQCKHAPAQSANNNPHQIAASSN